MRRVFNKLPILSLHWDFRYPFGGFFALSGLGILSYMKFIDLAYSIILFVTKSFCIFFTRSVLLSANFNSQRNSN